MQLDETTLTKYKSEAPELLQAAEPEGDGWIMRKDEKSGYCVKFDSGRCGIHAARGEKFLGDACHFYPRVTRRLGDKVVMTAALSCPEIARLAFADSGGDFYVAQNADRLPHGIRSYGDGDISGEAALAIHQAFIDAVDDRSVPVETIFARISSVSHSLPMIEKKDWPQAAPLYLKLADERLPPPEKNINDAFNLLHALCGLIAASKKPMSDRLKQTVSDMERALAVSLDWHNVLIHTGEDSLPSYLRISHQWKAEAAAHHENILRRYLKMQLSLSLFPFAGLGDLLPQRATILGVRLATIKLALMCGCGIYTPILPQEIVVRMVQSLSRFLDHLGDPAFSLLIYKETGWDRENRMRGLLDL